MNISDAREHYIIFIQGRAGLTASCDGIYSTKEGGERGRFC